MTLKKMHPQTTRGWARADVVAILTILLGLGLLASSALGKMRPQVQRATCAGNLRQLGAAWKSWAAEHDNQPPWYVAPSKGGSAGWQEAYLHYLLLSNYVENPAIFVCPGDEARMLAKDFTSGTNGLAALKNKAVGYFFAYEISMNDNFCTLAGDAQINGWKSTCAGVGGDYPRLSVLKIGEYVGAGWRPEVHNIGVGNLLFVDSSVQAVKRYSPLLRNSVDGNGSGCAVVPTF